MQSSSQPSSNHLYHCHYQHYHHYHHDSPDHHECYFNSVHL
jgi:hypothetical protein